MDVSLGVVILLHVLVNFLLLMGTSLLCGASASPFRAALGGGLTGIYAWLCMCPHFHFLSSFPWRCTALLLSALLAFGMEHTIRRCAVFGLINLAMSGVLQCLDQNSFWSVTGAGVLLCLLVILALRGNDPYTQVELSYMGRSIKVTALRDTGNTLRDPVTGGPVLVVDCATAEKLTGLSPGQLQRPVETIGRIPGLRLIPYRSVGTANGLMLGLQLREVKIGTWQGSRVVAFAPGELSTHGEYQALTGGIP